MHIDSSVYDITMGPHAHCQMKQFAWACCGLQQIRLSLMGPSTTVHKQSVKSACDSPTLSSPQTPSSAVSSSDSSTISTPQQSSSAFSSRQITFEFNHASSSLVWKPNWSGNPSMCKCTIRLCLWWFRVRTLLPNGGLIV